MNRCLRAYYVLIAASLLFFAGCDLTENDKSENTGRILNKSPYKGITDSIQQFPSNPKLHLQRAVLLSQNNLHEIATDDYRKAWEITGDEGVAMEYAANLLLVDEIEVAVNLLKQGRKKFPENTEFSRRLGELYAQVGETDKALGEYNVILQKDSANFETWYDKGVLLAQLKDTAGAIAALEQSFSIMPINFSGLTLANLYASTKNKKALEICDMLLAKDSIEQPIDAIFIKGIYYAETKQFQSALQQFEECIQRDWKMIDAHIEKGIVLFDMQSYDNALEAFKLAATVSNTYADAYFWMGRCYEAMGKSTEAIRNYERTLSLDQSFNEARKRLKSLTNS